VASRSSSNGFEAGFARADADRLLEREHEDLAIADLAVRATLVIASMTCSQIESSTASSILVFGTKSTRYSAPR